MSISVIIDFSSYTKSEFYSAIFWGRCLACLFVLPFVCLFVCCQRTLILVAAIVVSLRSPLALDMVNTNLDDKIQLT